MNLSEEQMAQIANQAAKQAIQQATQAGDQNVQASKATTQDIAAGKTDARSTEKSIDDPQVDQGFKISSLGLTNLWQGNFKLIFDDEATLRASKKYNNMLFDSIALQERQSSANLGNVMNYLMAVKFSNMQGHDFAQAVGQTKYGLTVDEAQLPVRNDESEQAKALRGIAERAAGNAIAMAMQASQK